MKRIIVCIKPVPDPKHWDKVSMDPDTQTLKREGIPSVINPLDKHALEAAAPRSETSHLDHLGDDDLGLLRSVQALLPDDGTRLLLLIDQFEELVHQVPDARVRDRFARNLAEAIGLDIDCLSGTYDPGGSRQSCKYCCS